jgi:hypothetical protein
MKKLKKFINENYSGFRIVSKKYNAKKIKIICPNNHMFITTREKINNDFFCEHCSQKKDDKNIIDNIIIISESLIKIIKKTTEELKKPDNLSVYKKK